MTNASALPGIHRTTIDSTIPIEIISHLCCQLYPGFIQTNITMLSFYRFTSTVTTGTLRLITRKSWQKKTLSVLLALSEENHRLSVASSHKAPVMQSRVVLIVVSLNKLSNKQSRCGWFGTPWRPRIITLIVLCYSGWVLGYLGWLFFAHQMAPQNVPSVTYPLCLEIAYRSNLG